MKAHLSQDIFSRLWTANLLGGEFANCYGQGSDPVAALLGLKFTVWWNRRQKILQETKSLILPKGVNQFKDIKIQSHCGNYST